MISNLISKAFWNSYARRCEADQAEHARTQAVLKDTEYLKHHPGSIFYIGK